MPQCEAHPEREGQLTVDLPSIRLQRFMCPDCRAAFIHSQTSSQWKGKREDWMDKIRYQDEQAPDGRYILKDNQGFYRPTRDELEGWK